MCQRLKHFAFSIQRMGGFMADCEYAELFNSCLLVINPLAPTVDPDEFRRIVDVLECDEFTALYVLGTHVPPERALILNRKLPPSILENSYLVKQVKKDLVTVIELANTFKVPVSEVSDFLRHAPLDSRGTFVLAGRTDSLLGASRTASGNGGCDRRRLGQWLRLGRGAGR
jgi:hypothetical protein